MTTKLRADVSAVGVAQQLRVLVSRLRRRLQEESSIGDLSAPEASALARLTAGEPASASQLAGAERVRPQSMATTLATLQRRGLVRRESDPHDGRRQLLYLTDAGRAYAEGARSHRHEWLARAFAERLSAAELATVADALELLERVVEP